MNKKVLIIYHSHDENWKDILDKHIRVLITAGKPIDIYSLNEQPTPASKDWYSQYEKLLDEMSVIILLISKNLLDSNIMKSKELRSRFKFKQEGKFPIFILLINKCNWKKYQWMKNLPLFPGQEKLLADLGDYMTKEVLTALTDQVFITLFESKITGGILAYLKLQNTGHITQLVFEPLPRLNIVTGDNSFGKTLLLECVWWALTGNWPKFQVFPNEKTYGNEAGISFQLRAKSGVKGNLKTVMFDYDKYQWPGNPEGTNSSSLVIYARADGSFGLWDPVKSKIPPPPGFEIPESPIIFDKWDVFNGITEKREGKMDRKICAGMLSHWINWQDKPDLSFDLFTKILKILSSISQEPLTPSKPFSIPGYDQPIPSLKYSYGDVPITHAASSVQRIISMVYLVVWMWKEHKTICEQTRKSTYKNMVIIIDEAESHLHPLWQRTIIPALLEVKKYLDKELDIQFIVTTHSPLLLTSVEPVFDEDNDRLFHLEMKNNQIEINTQFFMRHGRVDNWFISETFQLKQARSLEAERAILDAIKIQRKDKPDKEEVIKIHCQLTRLLSEFDTFWPRWIFFAQKHGVTDDSCGKTK
jgi:hypothetical protein